MRLNLIHGRQSLILAASVVPIAAFASVLGGPGGSNRTTDAAWLATGDRPPETVLPNDNRRPAGELRDGVLYVELEARRGLFHPQGADGPGFDVIALAEKDGPLQAPAPLIRVESGTDVHLTVTNTIDGPMTLQGLHDREGEEHEPIEIPAGATREIAFRASTPGSYFYFGRAVDFGPPPERPGIFRDSPLSGALVVDPPGGSADDRVLVVGLWVSQADVQAQREEAAHTFLINGLSWPFTEPLDAVVGDSVRVRVVNVSPAPHPMHLHGFYYQVEARGDARLDTVYTPEQYRLAVTEHMSPRTTMTFSWLPKREGHWLFHCHFIAHISAEQHVRRPETIVHGENGVFPGAEERGHEMMHEHAYQGMAGLMMGVLVRDPEAKGLREPEDIERRALRVYANMRENYFGEDPAYGYILKEGAEPPALDSVLIPGTPIILQRDEPVEVTVVNRTPIAITVHWHGIELDAIYDGIAGWSGAGSRLTPAITAGDSFVTHMEEAAQLSSGLYAPLIVLEPGKEYDPETDHILLLGWGGPGEHAPPFLNGSAEPPPLELARGKAHLLRFINITPSNNQNIRLLRGDEVVEWRRYSKDGAAVAPHQAIHVPAEQYLGAGETYDFEIMTETAEELTLEVTTGAGRYPIGSRSFERVPSAGCVGWATF
jgi:FtsP/CotA-like multicopper oxidase with cupredoxin domain